MVAESNPYLLISGWCLTTSRANMTCLISKVQTECLWEENQKPDVYLAIFQDCCLLFQGP